MVLRDRKRTQEDPVAIAKWTHLNSYRTQKLSTFTATIVGLAPAKIASCRVFFLCRINGFFSGRHRAYARQKGTKKGEDPKRVLGEAERASEREKRRNEKKRKKVVAKEEER